MYTALNNPTIEESLQHQLDVIVKGIVETYGADTSIVLAGGFGRGEGSVLQLDQKTTVPLHDFDIYAITTRRVDSEKHASMEEKIYSQLRKTIGPELTPDRFALGVEVIPYKSISRLPPDISAYELKAASTVLHGPDVRHLIPITREKVAISSGAITLFHRTTALLKNVEPEFLALKRYPEGRILESIYECCKVYTEICTALSLIGGFYYPSYRERAARLPEFYKIFPELRTLIPDLPEKVKMHTDMKLQSDFSPIMQDPVEEWLQARHDLEISLCFFLSKMFDIPFSPEWSEIYKPAGKKFRPIFFRDYLASYLARMRIAASPLVRAANTAFQTYDYVSFKKRVKQDGKIPPKRLISFTSPLQHIYLASASVLFSLEDGGEIERDLLRIGEDYLARIFGDCKADSTEKKSWQHARDECLDAQRLYFIRQQKRTA
jgi:hypothetical protein